jgi:RNA polymerase sigma-B factor
VVNRVFGEEHTPPLFTHALPERASRAEADRLVANYAYLCRRGARKFWRAGLERCDLEQVAAIGLIKASRRFEPSAQTPFEAYAWLTIVGELMHHVRDHERLVRTPRRIKALELTLVRSRDALVGRLGREPQDGELASEMGVDERLVTEVRRAAAAATVLPLDDPDARAVVSGSSTAQEDRLLIIEALSRLSAIERKVVVGVDVLGITQLELGRILGLSARRVSRVRRHALLAMQRAWAS